MSAAQSSKKSVSESSGENSAKSTTTWSKIRENIEAVLVAIILALIIRHFSVEAFEIPTGSMAPGLHGVHIDSRCPNCDYVTQVGLKTDQSSGRVDAQQFGRGWIYDGPCTECGSHVEDVPRLRETQRVPAGHPVYCWVCQKHVPGEPDSFRRTALFGEISAAYCPTCTFSHREIYEPADCLSGHKILVNKFLYQLREPRRWEVIVFKFNRQRNYIKRLIGLPGESIQVIDGDIWIDGEIERKPVSVQDDMWRLVHDSTLEENERVRPAWIVREGKGWLFDKSTGAFKFNTTDGQECDLAYQRTIANRYPYNSGDRRSAGVVRDIRIETHCLLNQGSGYLDLMIVNGTNVYTCHLVASDAGGGEAATSYIGYSGRPTGGEVETLVSLPTRLTRGESQHLDFYIADRLVVLRVDGEIVCEHPLDGEHHREFAQQMNTSVGLRCNNVGLHLDHVRLYRDIHYTWLQRQNVRYACEEPYSIPPVQGPDGVTIQSGRGYFAMGDNSPSSLDSRAWGFVPEENMLGRAMAIFWPAIPWKHWEVGFIR